MKITFGFLILFSMAAPAQDVDKALSPPAVSGSSAPVKSKVENADFVAWKVKLLQETGLNAGFYNLEKGPKSCQFGELQIKNVGTSASLMFSDHAVLIQMPWNTDAPGQREEDEDGCRRSYKYKYSKGLIHGVQTVTCKDSTGDEHYDMDLKMDGKTLIFSIQNQDHPKQKGEVCRLTLKPDGR